MSEKSPKNIKNTCKTNIYKFRANSKKAQQVNPSPFKSAQVPWTYFCWYSQLFNLWHFSLDDYLQVLEKEVNIDFCRSMNRIIFDKTVHDDPQTFAFVTLPEEKVEPVPEKG